MDIYKYLKNNSNITKKENICNHTITYPLYNICTELFEGEFTRSMYYIYYVLYIILYIYMYYINIFCTIERTQ